MARWYSKLYATGSANDADLMVALDAADFYEEKHKEARVEFNIEGRVERMAAKIPGITEYWYGQLQDLESILDYLEQREKRALIRKQEDIMNHYQRVLTHTQARDYADASDEVKVIRDVRTRVAYVRNLFLGIMKGLECMHFQISNVTKLRCAGLEDAVIDMRTDGRHYN